MDSVRPVPPGNGSTQTLVLAATTLTRYGFHVRCGRHWHLEWLQHPLREADRRPPRLQPSDHVGSDRVRRVSMLLRPPLVPIVVQDAGWLNGRPELDPGGSLGARGQPVLHRRVHGCRVPAGRAAGSSLPTPRDWSDTTTQGTLSVPACTLPGAAPRRLEECRSRTRPRLSSDQGQQEYPCPCR